MKKIFYNKLIRDKIPAKMDVLDVEYKVRKLGSAEFKTELLKKVEEEASGVAISKSRKEIIAELADLIDVLEEVTQVYKISDQEIKTAQKSNAEKKGGFAGKIFLEWSADNGYKTNEKRTVKAPRAK